MGLLGTVVFLSVNFVEFTKVIATFVTRLVSCHNDTAVLHVIVSLLRLSV